MKPAKLFLTGVLSFLPALAMGEVLQYDNPLGGSITDLPHLVQTILSIIIKVGIPLASVFIIYAGFLFVTAAGDEGKVTAAKGIFLWTLVGTGVILGAWIFAVGFNNTISSLFQ